MIAKEVGCIKFFNFRWFFYLPGNLRGQLDFPWWWQVYFLEHFISNSAQPEALWFLDTRPEMEKQFRTTCWLTILGISKAGSWCYLMVPRMQEPISTHTMGDGKGRTKSFDHLETPEWLRNVSKKFCHHKHEHYKDMDKNIHKAKEVNMWLIISMNRRHNKVKN